MSNYFSFNTVSMLVGAHVFVSIIFIAGIEYN